MVNSMKKIVELPLVEPMYSTYHFQGSGLAVLESNPSICNRYLNEILILECNRKFLSGFTTPDIGIVDSKWDNNPYLERRWFSTQFIRGYINPVIRNLLDAGYYVVFTGVDDYYMEGKSWSGKRHMPHDGLICGYNQEDKTYCIYAYDSNWIYRKFWVKQSSFNAGIRAMARENEHAQIWGIKPKPDEVEFSADIACKKIAEYLDSDYEKYPEDGEGMVHGIVVHDYIAKYAGKLLDGSIPYERMDWRVFRLIREHKKVMHERIRCIEKALGLPADISERYEPLIAEADMMRMLYASHFMKRRDSVLPIIQKKLLAVKEKEQALLGELLEKAGGAESK